MHFRKILAALVLILPVRAQVQPTPLTALNDAFRAAYAEAKVRVLAASGPTLIVSGDNFSLLRSGQRLEANAGTPIYDPVKTIAHIPLALYVTLTPGDGALDESGLKTLAGLRALIPPAEQSLDSLKLPAATLARQKQIVAASLAYLDQVAAGRKFVRAELLAFTRRMTPLVMENVNDATRAQLDATHAVVSKWKAELTADEWSRLHVVIIGPHMPREDLVVTQYFLRLLHEPREGRKVVYAESMWQEQQAMDLLGTHLLDGDVGEAFFSDYLRMHRDLLGDAAKKYLPKLLP
ncbi:MAG TPA: hypothetical protein VG456_18035 [Candidatus Sulfopaludibacter sp.]|jgi:hypothetical protein|nr:hypothetical protein [Candidatus Sulfopaludibacter sp.]